VTSLLVMGDEKAIRTMAELNLSSKGRGA